MTSGPTPPTRRLLRHREGRLVAGVATGLADHLHIDVLFVRIGFVVTVVLGGLGLVLYATFWAVVPLASDDPAATAEPATTRIQLAGFASLGLGVLLGAQFLGFGPGLLWPAAAAVAGVAMLWRQADEASRQRWLSAAGRQTRAVKAARGPTLLRYLVGVLLVLVGMATFLAAHGALPQARRALLPVVVAVGGLVIVVGPWILQALRQLADERTARIREHERVELAGRVHDSMLQTLTLIQRRANDPDEVRRLVRHSSRELRGWLYAPASAGTTLHEEVSAVCAAIDEEYGVSVDLVMVGEPPVTDATQPLVQALREAAVNAARHAGVEEIAVYVETSPTEVVVFVRDRGRGFALEAVPADRFGVRESVIGRMRRNGGEASIRSSPSTGTEVRLRLPLLASAQA